MKYILLLAFVIFEASAYAQHSYPAYEAMRLDNTLSYFLQSNTAAAIRGDLYMSPPLPDYSEDYDYLCPAELKQDLNLLHRTYQKNNMVKYRKQLDAIEQKYKLSIETYPKK